jgi:pimeloyl-ACP methyl ester carboxylesterase
MSMRAVVLLPGLLEDADVFAHQVAGLAEVADCTVADLTRSETIEGLAHDVLAQAPEKFALVAHSMGGYVALDIVRQAPQRVTALALLNTNARADSAEATQNRQRLIDLAARDFAAVIATLLPKQLTAKGLANTAITGTITQMAHAVGPEAFVRQQKAIMGRIDSRPRLGEIRCPTLVVAARDDAIMPLEVLEELAHGIPAARLVVIDDCGHASALEQPEAVTDALHEWLTGEPPRGADVVAGTRRPPPA